MSNSELSALRNRVNGDHEFSRQVFRAYQQGSLQSLMRLIEEQGVSCNEEELRAFLEEQSGSDLSDLELELVSAGTPVTCSDT